MLSISRGTRTRDKEPKTISYSRKFTRELGNVYQELVKQVCGESKNISLNFDLYRMYTGFYRMTFRVSLFSLRYPAIWNVVKVRRLLLPPYNMFCFLREILPE